MADLFRNFLGGAISGANAVINPQAAQLFQRQREVGIAQAQDQAKMRYDAYKLALDTVPPFSQEWKEIASEFAQALQGDPILKAVGMQVNQNVGSAMQRGIQNTQPPMDFFTRLSQMNRQGKQGPPAPYGTEQIGLPEGMTVQGTYDAQGTPTGSQVTMQGKAPKEPNFLNTGEIQYVEINGQMVPVTVQYDPNTKQTKVEQLPFQPGPTAFQNVDPTALTPKTAQQASAETTKMIDIIEQQANKNKQTLGNVTLNPDGSLKSFILEQMKPPAETEIRYQTQRGTIMRAAKTAMEYWKPEYTGPLQGRWYEEAETGGLASAVAELGSSLGLDIKPDAQGSVVRGLITSLIKLGYTDSGKQLSNKELAIIKKWLPENYQIDETLPYRLSHFIKDMESLMQEQESIWEQSKMIPVKVNYGAQEGPWNNFPMGQQNTKPVGGEGIMQEMSNIQKILDSRKKTSPSTKPSPTTTTTTSTPQQPATTQAKKAPDLRGKPTPEQMDLWFYQANRLLYPKNTMEEIRNDEEKKAKVIENVRRKAAASGYKLD